MDHKKTLVFVALQCECIATVNLKHILELKNLDYSPDSNNCTDGSMQCADLCLATPDGPHCDCAMGFETDSQNPNLCDPITNFTQV